MASWSRALAVCLAAVAVAHASVTVQWNTRAASPASSRTAVVCAVNGTRVVLHLSDGTSRTYTATPAQAKMLRGLIGSTIRYRIEPR
jgi:hypothetical protein